MDDDDACAGWEGECRVFAEDGAVEGVDSHVVDFPEARRLKVSWLAEVMLSVFFLVMPSLPSSSKVV